VPDGALTDADAWDIAVMAARTGRAVPPGKWVEDLIRRAQADSFGVLM
jgi:hypothetical protein